MGSEGGAQVIVSRYVVDSVGMDAEEHRYSGGGTDGWWRRTGMDWDFERNPSTGEILGVAHDDGEVPMLAAPACRRHRTSIGVELTLQ